MKKITTRMCSGEAREEDADLLSSVAIKSRVARFVLLEKPLPGLPKVLSKSFAKIS